MLVILLDLNYLGTVYVCMYSGCCVVLNNCFKLMNDYKLHSL